MHLMLSEPRRLRIMLRADCVQDVHVTADSKDIAGIVADWSDESADDRIRLSNDGTFIVMEGMFQDGDCIDWIVRSPFHAEALSGDPTRVVLLYGNVLLAAAGSDANIPESCQNNRSLAEHAHRQNGTDALRFLLRRDGFVDGHNAPLQLKPVYAVGEETYSAYFNVDESHPWIPEEFVPVASGEN